MKRKQKIPRKIGLNSNRVPDAKPANETICVSYYPTDDKKQKINENVPDINNIPDIEITQPTTSTIVLGDAFKNYLRNEGFPLILNVYSLSNEAQESKKLVIKPKQNNFPVTPPYSPPVKDTVVTSDEINNSEITTGITTAYSPQNITTTSNVQSNELFLMNKQQQTLNQKIVSQNLSDNLGQLTRKFTTKILSQKQPLIHDHCKKNYVQNHNLNIFKSVTASQPASHHRHDNKSVNRNQSITTIHSYPVLPPSQVPEHRELNITEKEPTQKTSRETRIARLKKLVKEQEENLERLKAGR